MVASCDDMKRERIPRQRVSTMILWRIARRVHALDRLGIGARETGGRWNHPGVSVIYAGCTIAIAAFERFVHVSGLTPPDLVLVRIDLPAKKSAPVMQDAGVDSARGERAIDA